MDSEPMPLLLFLFVVAALQLAIGVLVARAGATTIQEQWILCHRGIRRPAIAERLTSKVGPLAVYRFLDGEGRTRVANAGRIRALPAVEVEIVYDPRNTTLACEKPGLMTGIFGAIAVAIGMSLMGLAVTAIVMLAVAWP